MLRSAKSSFDQIWFYPGCSDDPEEHLIIDNVVVGIAGVLYLVHLAAIAARATVAFQPLEQVLLLRLIPNPGPDLRLVRRQALDRPDELCNADRFFHG